MVYKGQEVLLAELVTRPSNSIIHQSRHSPYLPYLQGTAEEIKARNHAINGDGFGVAWYDHICTEEPCVFTSVQPSWHCSNLQNLAHHIRTHCIFAHVRAASPGSLIAQSNCHPFKFGRLLFMHNGGIAHFEQIKYSILHSIQRTSASYIRGTTDSEHAGALLVHYLGDPNAVHDGHALKGAMLKMMSHLVGLIRWQEAKMSPTSPHHEPTQQHTCEGHMPSSLNFAVTDGRVVIATRYRDSKEQDPPSLYYSEAQQMIDEDGAASPMCWKYPSKRLIDSIVISSEPLTKDEAAWKLVPRNHLLVVTNSQRTVIEPIHLRTLYSSSDSVDIFEPDASASELAAAGKWDESQQAATQLAAAALATIPSSISLAVPTRAQAQAHRQHTRRHSAQSHPAAAGAAVGSPRGSSDAAKPPKRKTVSSTNLVAAGAADRLRSKHSRSRSGGDKAVVDKVVGGDKGDDKAGADDEKKKKNPWKGKEETREEWDEREDAITKQQDDELKKKMMKKKELKLQKLKQQMQERGSGGGEKISASTTGASVETTTATLRSLVDFWRGFATGLCAALVLLALVFTAVYLGVAQTTQRHKEDL